jgi:dephospho-CoA kinase
VITLGLTGSIGMGKSATARMFECEGAPVYDADAAVHELYGVGGAAVAPVSAAFPGVAPQGFIDRERLAALVLNDREALGRLEAIVHPLVGAHRAGFFERVADEPVVVLDIPLLFETRGEAGVDAVAVVSAPAWIQRSRVLERAGMTVEKLEAILARQTPDDEKRSRADFVIDTSRGFEHAHEQVRDVLRSLHDPAWWAGRKAPLDGGGGAAQYVGHGAGNRPRHRNHRARPALRAPGDRDRLYRD